MTQDRRRFLKLGLSGSALALMDPRSLFAARPSPRALSSPVILSTWDHGIPANTRASKVLEEGGSILDAVEKGVMVVESDLTNRSVGLGGRPDRDGHVTLDACIQDHDGKAGGVAFVEHFEHPISLARAVMERTPHVLLVGDGAERWALENGFKTRKVDIPEVRKDWKEWLRTSEYKPVVNIENHDTIGMVGLDANGRMAGSCTTSGLAYKIHGRVGDSPIIGAGLFVDGDVGAACATGTGELVIRVAGSHSVVELMRQGMHPTEACRTVVQRILDKNPQLEGHQVGFLAIRADGEYGAFSIYEGFSYARTIGDRTDLIGSEFMKKYE